MPQPQKQQSKSQPQTRSIEKHKPAAIEEVPKHLQRTAGAPQAGFEEVGAGDITIPQLRLCQALTPQKTEGEAKYIEGLRDGEHFNTVTGENYGKLVQIVPLMMYKNRIRFAPKDEGGGILCRSDDMVRGVGDPGVACVTCEFNKFGSAKNGEGKGKACTEFFNFPVLVIPEDGEIDPSHLAVKSFKSSGVPVAKDWLAKMRLRKVDMFGGVYALTSAPKKFAEGTSYIEVVNNAGFVEPTTYAVAKSVYEMFAAMRASGKIKIDEQEHFDSASEDPDAPNDARE